jgi:ATP-binding cassette, subfamily B, bacterial
VGSVARNRAAVIGGLRRIRESVIWRLLRPQRNWILGLAVLGFLALGIGLGQAGAIRDIVDKAITDKSQPLGPLIDKLVSLSVMGFFVGVGQRQVIARIGYQLEFELRMWLYQRLQETDPERLDELETGQVVTRAMTDLLVLEQVIAFVPALAVGLTLLTALALFLFVQSPLMAVVALTGIPINLWIVKRMSRRLGPLSWLVLQRRAQVTGAIDEPVRGIRVVKAFGREDEERSRVATAAADAFRAAMTRIRLVASYNLVLKALPTVLDAILLIVAGRLVVHQNLTVGKLLIFLAFGRIFTSFATSFGDIASAFQFARAGAGRIVELMSLAEKASAHHGVSLPPSTDGLVFEAVGHLDFAVAPGKLVVLDGPSGSGRSTIAAMACGRRPAADGRVLLDGVEVQALDRRELRRAVRVLDASPFLFGRNVRDNLLLGVAGTGPTDDDLRAVLIAAAADSIVDQLPDGLDTVIGDRGLTLSGGQRQRLALARALVVPPRLLVLDDALSAVDAQLEAEIISRIRDYAPAMSILWATSRPSALALADHVVELPARASAHRGPVEVLPSMLGVQLGIVECDDQPGVSDDDALDDTEVPTVRSVTRPLLRAFVSVTGLLLALTAVGLVAPGLFKIAVDGLKRRSHADSDKIAFALLGVAVVLGLLTYVFELSSKRVLERLLYLLRRRVFQRLSRLGIDFYDRELPGRVAARIVYDLDQIAGFLDHGIYTLVTGAAVLVMASVVIAVWSPSVASVVVWALPAAAVLTAIQVPVAARAYVVTRRRLGDVVARFQEDFAGRHVIASFGAEATVRSAFRADAQSLRTARRWSTSVSNVYVEAVQAVAGLAVAALFSRAGHLVLAGRLSLGSLVALDLYLGAALAPIPLLSVVLQSYLAARASFRTLGQPFVATVFPIDDMTARACPPLQGDVELDRVSFAYPGTDRTVIHNVSTRVEPGSMLAVVGPTGAGKSSLAKLLARVYDPDEGTVRVDGYDLRSLESASYRRRLGVVPQDAFCFRGTVRSNVAYGRPDASDAEVERAMAEVGATEALGSLDAPVDEEGRNLSAAQRQLLALARAWLVEPDVLVLDEATATLDEDAERAVLDAVSQRHCTTIVVAHRLAVAQRATQVAFIDDGRIVAWGTHDGLMAAGGAYAALWLGAAKV